MVNEPEPDVPMTRYRGIVQATGEVIDIDAPAVRGRKRRTRRRVFALVDLESLSRLELTGREWDVLHRIMRAVNPETNEAKITADEIALDVEMKPSNVSRVISTLRQRHILITMRRSVHRINANIMFRGSTEDWGTVSSSERMPLWKR